MSINSSIDNYQENLLAENPGRIPLEVIVRPLPMVPYLKIYMFYKIKTKQV